VARAVARAATGTSAVRRNRGERTTRYLQK
jgi:hypothetical protein